MRGDKRRGEDRGEGKGRRRGVGAYLPDIHDQERQFRYHASEPDRQQITSTLFPGGNGREGERGKREGEGTHRPCPQLLRLNKDTCGATMMRSHATVETNIRQAGVLGRVRLS